MSLNKVSIKIGGPAGSGVFTIGLLLSKYFQKAGLNVVYTTDYPSLIKGGHNTCCVRAEDDEINAEVKMHDVLVALNQESIDIDLKELRKGGILICAENSKIESNDYQIFKVPFEKLLDGLDKRVLNTIGFGAVIGVMGPNGELFEDAISAHFHKKKKGDSIIEQNIKAAEFGYKFTKEICERENKGYLGRITKRDNPLGKTIFLSGNDAAAIAAIRAGVKFVGEYPMTPSTSFLHYMAAHELDYNITTKQTEDEIAAINTVIGASIAGVRAMSATSGGGFALMNEAIGFAAIGETPLVVFECMRAGPSTGLPTYTDQGDLKFVINCSQGEFPMVVLAPGDVEESFYESFRAFNIADQVQTPVIVLLDKHLAATQWTAKRFESKSLVIDRGNYHPLNDEVLPNNKRHEFTKNGISMRFNPGQPGGMYVNSSYEHDESGFTSEDPKNHEMMMEKRFKKLESISKDIIRPKMYGPVDADLTIIGWGSTKGVALDAIKYLNRDGIKVNYLHFVYINPFDNDYVLKTLKNCKDTIILEGNYTGQLRDIIREKTGFYIEKTYLKYDGRPFFFEEVYTKIKEVLKK